MAPITDSLCEWLMEKVNIWEIGIDEIVNNKGCVVQIVRIGDERFVQCKSWKENLETFV